MHKKVSYGGVAAAISVILLMMSGYLPSGKAATLFLASLVVSVMCAITDKKTALAIYAATVLSAFLLVPSAVVIVLSYLICFGNYPVFKATIEERLGNFSGYLTKTILYTFYFFLAYAVFVFVVKLTIPYAVYLLYLGGFFVFVFYDWLLSKTGVYILNRFFNIMQ